MHCPVTFLVEHPVVLVVLEITRNNPIKILEIIVGETPRPMVVVEVREVEVAERRPMDRIVAIITIIIQMKMVRMAMVRMIHRHNHLHGLVVVIIREVDRWAIEYDRSMSGKST